MYNSLVYVRALPADWTGWHQAPGTRPRLLLLLLTLSCSTRGRDRRLTADQSPPSLTTSTTAPTATQTTMALSGRTMLLGRKHKAGAEQPPRLWQISHTRLWTLFTGVNHQTDKDPVQTSLRQHGCSPELSEKQTTSSPPCLRCEKPSRSSHPAIFIHRLPSAWCGISGIPCAIIKHFTTHKMSTILKLMQSLCVDCGGFRSVEQPLQSIWQAKSPTSWSTVSYAYGNLYE